MCRKTVEDIWENKYLKKKEKQENNKSGETYIELKIRPQ